MLFRSTGDMEEMTRQVGPAVEKAVEAAESIQAAQVLSQQRERMFLSLTGRGRELAAKLGAEAPSVPAQGHADAATLSPGCGTSGACKVASILRLR